MPNISNTKKTQTPVENSESMFRNVIERLERKTKFVRILYFIKNDFVMRMNFKMGDFSTKSGTFSSKSSIKETLDYINTLSSLFLEHIESENEGIHGKTVLELGPGDNLGLAIMLLLSGAKRVVCLDKFYPERNNDYQVKIYNAMREKLDQEKTNLFDDIVKLDNDEIIFNEEKLQYISGVGIEEAVGKFDEKSFNIIISSAVMEHVYDPDAAFHAMDKLLADNGCMIHGIDFRDHGMFSSVGMNPLTFLTISDPIWKLMTYHSGKPNRKLVDYYRNKMLELGYDSRILIRRLVGCNSRIVPPKENLEPGIDIDDSTLLLVDEIKPKLWKRFKKIDTKDLIIAGAILVGKKG